MHSPCRALLLLLLLLAIADMRNLAEGGLWAAAANTAGGSKGYSAVCLDYTL